MKGSGPVYTWPPKGELGYFDTQLIHLDKPRVTEAWPLYDKNKEHVAQRLDNLGLVCPYVEEGKAELRRRVPFWAFYLCLVEYSGLVSANALPWTRIWARMFADAEWRGAWQALVEVHRGGGWKTADSTRWLKATLPPARTRVAT